MSNTMRGTSLLYFQTPDSFMTAEIKREMSKSSMWVYSTLWKHSQKNSKLTLKFSGQDLAAACFMAESQLPDARNRLIKAGLIQVKKQGTSLAYTLCDPESGLPIVKPVDGRIKFDDISKEGWRAYYEDRLPGANFTVTDNGLLGTCPFRAHSRPKLEVKLTEGSSWHCHGCEQQKGRPVHLEYALASDQGDEISSSEARRRILDTLRRLNVIDASTGVPEAVYPYHNEKGKLVFEFCRYPGKKFAYRQKDKSGKYIYQAKGLPKLVYHLPDVMQADLVFVVEGEKDADRLDELGLRDDNGLPVAVTTNAGGAGKWKLDHAMQLKGKRVLLIGDNDESGRGSRHMESVHKSLRHIALEVLRVELPVMYKDVYDFLESKDLHSFITLIPDGWLEQVYSI